MDGYDSIAEAYGQDALQRDDRACVLVPSARHYCGDVRGLRVLDLACGAGFFSHLFRSWGAARVVGVDVSAEMVRQAGEGEYLVADVATLGVIGEFDLVFAGFLLHYAPTVSVLERMAQAVAGNLRPGGRFVSFNENPYLPVHSGTKYGVSVTRDGDRITRAHETFSFSHYTYAASAYEAALEGAGLQDVRWVPFVKAVGASEYWDEYLTDFSITTLLARKGAE